LSSSSDEGFGAHDVCAPPASDKSFDPKAIVENPDFALPFSGLEKKVRSHLPERPGRCCAQMTPDPFFQRIPKGDL
jgi:hypothetical protein